MGEAGSGCGCVGGGGEEGEFQGKRYWEESVTAPGGGFPVGMKMALNIAEFEWSIRFGTFTIRVPFFLSSTVREEI